jgi:hypothetical protein
MKIRLYFIVGMLMLSLFGCGDKPNANDPVAAQFKPNKAELGEDWKQFRHDAAQNVWVFPDNEPRPQEHQKPNGARVFYNGDVADVEHEEINGGISDTLAACKRPQNPAFRADLFPYFTKPADYKVIQVKSNYTVQEGEAKGCAGIITGAHGDCGGGEGTCSAAGTVAGLIERYDNHRPASKGGIYILIAKQSAEQLANPACRTFMRNAVRHEAEHVFFTNDTGLFFLYANDGVNGNHPYCK